MLQKLSVNLLVSAICSERTQDLKESRLSFKLTRVVNLLENNDL